MRRCYRLRRAVKGHAMCLRVEAAGDAVKLARSFASKQYFAFAGLRVIAVIVIAAARFAAFGAALAGAPISSPCIRWPTRRASSAPR